MGVEKDKQEGGKGGRGRKRGFCVCQREARDTKRKEEAQDGGDGRRAAGRLFFGDFLFGDVVDHSTTTSGLESVVAVFLSRCSILIKQPVSRRLVARSSGLLQLY